MPVTDLLQYIDRSPTPYHAVAEVARRLEAAGYRSLVETDLWDLSPGARHYVTRAEGSLIAFEIGAESPVTAGFRIVGAHSDSPNLRLKPRADLKAHGYRQLAVEPYGGLLLHTWLDRDLSIAGRLSLRDGESSRTLLIDFGRPLLRIPNLAIHLNRGVDKEGLKLNAQTHAAPLMALEEGPSLAELIASELRAQEIADIKPQDLLAFDLMLHDAQPAAVAGARGEFILAPRLDNLASCHAAVSALSDPGDQGLPSFTRVVVIYDHEEVGSRSAQGAAGPFLTELLERSIAAFKGGAPQGLPRAVARSTLISLDMAHAVHPNYADQHEPGHRPVIGRGLVIKTNAGQAYATDAATAGMIASLCSRVGIEPQSFVSRSDMPCGSTIGPISAARTGIRTADIGNPMLSMHSCREMAGTQDVQPMIELLRAFFSA